MQGIVGILCIEKPSFSVFDQYESLFGLIKFHSNAHDLVWGPNTLRVYFQRDTVYIPRGFAKKGLVFHRDLHQWKTFAQLLFRKHFHTLNPQILGALKR